VISFTVYVKQRNSGGQSPITRTFNEVVTWGKSANSALLSTCKLSFQLAILTPFSRWRKVNNCYHNALLIITHSFLTFKRVFDTNELIMRALCYPVHPMSCVQNYWSDFNKTLELCELLPNGLFILPNCALGLLKISTNCVQTTGMFVYVDCFMY